MPTNTTNFNFNKPNINSADDEDLWGDQLNDNWDAVDGYLKTARDFLVVAAKTAAYTVLTSDRNKLIQGDVSGGAFQITLPTASSAGDGFRVAVKKTDDSANALTVRGNGSETIDGANTYDLENQYNTVLLTCDGTSWHTLASPSADVADASTTVKGVVELATNAETQTGTDSARAVTPAALAATMLGGNGQSWQNVTSSRSNGTTYTNNTGRPIMVSCYASGSAGSTWITVDGLDVIISSFGGNNGTRGCCTIVPNGSTYRYNSSATRFELR